jgi:hypothetical protein
MHEKSRLDTEESVLKHKAALCRWSGTETPVDNADADRVVSFIRKEETEQFVVSKNIL